MRGGREGGGGRKQARKEEAGRMDGRREAGRQVRGSVRWVEPLHLVYVMSGCAPDSKSQRQAAGVWLRAEVGSCWSADVRWCVAVGFAPRTSDGSSLLHRARVIVRLSIQAPCPMLSSPVYASPTYVPKSRARTCPMDLGVFRRHQGKHGPTPPTSCGRTAPRPNSGNLAAQQGGQGKKLAFAHKPHHQIFNSAG